MSVRCAGLVIDNPNNVCPALFKKIAQLVQGVLYIPLCNDVPRDSETLPAGSQELSRIYQLSSQCTGQLDVRPIFAPPREHRLASFPPLSTIMDAIVTTSHHSVEELRRNPYFLQLSSRQEMTAIPKIFHVDVAEKENIENVRSVPPAKPPLKLYNSVAVGGTFDHFHDGHRLFLSQAVLMARERILVGIAHGPLLVNKTLRELIEPVESRVGFVREFLSDMKPWLQIDVVPITDVFGPTATDGSLECLIITPDSARGGRAVNEERIKRGLPVMAIETVDMVSLGGGLTESVDDKLSSTAVRKQLLGEYVTPSLNRSPQHSVPSEDGPYVVGLTGGIASGKSSVARRLQALGAHIVDCDKLGHKAYEPGTATFCEIVETFGESVVGEGGQINRKTLGGMVFGSKAKMKELTDIVWPEILRLSQEEIKTAWSQGFKVCILDAAVLLEAEWDLHCHEVWVSVIPQSEALRRVVERDGVPEEAANKRIDAQITNEERISHAHVVLSTLWEREETQRQVDKAWKLLESRIAQKLKSSL